MDFNLFSPELISRVFSFIPHSGPSWMSVHLTCKLWNEIATRAFHDSKKINTSLLVAAKEGDIPTLEKCLSHYCADPSIKNNLCVRLAAANGHTEVVRILLQDPRVDVSDGLALCAASVHNKKEVIELLLNEGTIDPGKWQLDRMDPLTRTMYSLTLLKVFQAGIENQPSHIIQEDNASSPWSAFFSKRIRSHAVF